MSLDVDVARRLSGFGLRAAIDVAPGELVALYGHSGSGKSMTLRSIAGLDRPDEGRITLDGRTLFDAARAVNVPPHLRHVGLVVQQYALFPHLTAAENISYGLSSLSREARARRVAELITLFRVDGLEARMPHQLSGGQQQRVALARALAPPVDALLLDEPFSALDEALRAGLRSELLRLRHELAVPVVFVTHDLREAYLLADRIAVIDDGSVLQFAARDEVFRRPTSRRVAELLGVRNLYRGWVVATAPDSVEVEIGPLRWRCASWEAGLAVGDAVDVAVRSERVVLRRGDRPAVNGLDATIEAEEAYGANHLLHLRPQVGGPIIEVDMPARPYEVLGVATRKDWLVEIPPTDLHVMRASGVVPA